MPGVGLAQKFYLAIVYPTPFGEPTALVCKLAPTIDAYYLHFASKRGTVFLEARSLDFNQMKNKQRRRSDCPINHVLETFGDTWSLLIIRDIVYFGKRTYGEFLDSEEGIASNILASRLAHLEQTGILIKKPHKTDKRKEVYRLSERGLDLIPILLEMAGWSAQHDPQTAAPQAWIATVSADKEKLTRLIRETVRSGGSIFAGPDSVIGKLAGEAK